MEPLISTVFYLLCQANSQVDLAAKETLRNNGFNLGFFLLSVTFPTDSIACFRIGVTSFHSIIAIGLSEAMMLDLDGQQSDATERPTDRVCKSPTCRLPLRRRQSLI